MDTLSRKEPKGASDNEPNRNLIVRLIEPLPRPIITPIERLAVSSLKQEGAIPFQLLVEHVAFDLYREELRNGAWVLDIGLFGSRLFAPDVVREIEAGNGILWEIEKTEGH